MRNERQKRTTAQYRRNHELIFGDKKGDCDMCGHFTTMLEAGMCHQCSEKYGGEHGSNRNA